MVYPEVGDYFPDFRVAKRLSWSCRNRDEFFGKIDFDGRDLPLLAECFFDSGGAKSADHPVNGGRYRFRQGRGRQGE